MASWSDLIRAIAELAHALQWPLIVLIICILFREQVGELLQRLVHWKGMGVEADFAESVKELAEGTLRAQELRETAAEALPDEASIPEDIRVREHEVRDKVLSLAPVVPRGALMELSAEIEDALRRYVAKVDPTVPRTQSVQSLVRYILNPNPQDMPFTRYLLAQNLEAFWRVRNRVVHEAGIADEDLLRAIDSGLSILHDLNTLPVPLPSDRATAAGTG